MAGRFRQGSGLDATDGARQGDLAIAEKGNATNHQAQSSSRSDARKKRRAQGQERSGVAKKGGRHGGSTVCGLQKGRSGTSRWSPICLCVL
ncbi:hypothetical protein MACH15_27090 [Maricaulis maris]|nr:hypothetical protein MACH15_27090 [Maricaulis maris]